jgi:hypothetical protein
MTPSASRNFEYVYPPLEVPEPPRASWNISLFFANKSKKRTSKFLLLIVWMDVARRRCGMLEAMTYFWRDSFDSHC